MQTAFPLPRWIQPEPYEPPHGCLLRLAECNGLPGTSAVRSMTGLSVARIKSGRDLEDLALVLHCDVEKLRANATFKSNNAQAAVGAQILRPRADLTAGSRRACPVCLTEAPYHRVWWDWAFVSGCPFHGCMLAKNCSCGSALTWKDGSPCKCRLCKDGDVRRLTLEPAGPKVVALDRWAVDRFLHPDRAPVHFIDRIPLGHAAEMMTRIGALGLGGYQPQRPGLSELGGPHVVRAHGFHSIVTGTVDTALDRSYEEYVAATQDSTPSLSRMYGWFYPWFVYTGGPRLCPDLGEIILKNASKKIQVTRRAFLPLLRDGMGSLTLGEAASMAKVGFGTMRAMLGTEGYIRKKQRRGVPALVERATAERIAADLRQSLTLTSLGKVLGLSFTALTKLVRSGLTPIWVRGGVQGRHRYLFRVDDLSRWIETIIGAAPTVRGRPHGTVSLADAPRRCSIAITVLVRAIVAGELKVAAVLGKRRNFMSALVDIETVFAYKEKIGSDAAKDPRQNYVFSK
jgi:hypothetical protein